ncbi:MAG TPA: hypothetical protein VK456_01595 [Xanthobacteraceae bacterium]|nr:hypothetical protein [Xanthobacteraceae bacterium]
MSGGRGILWLGLCALSLLSACASTPLPQTLPKAQDPRQTRIYVLCEADVCGGAAHPGVKIDDQSIGDLTSAGFLFADRAPGQHVVSVSLLQNYYPLTLATRPGFVHYVHVKARPAIESFLTAGLLTQAVERAATGHNGALVLVELSEPDGRALLQKLATTPNDTRIDPNPRS